MYDNIKVVIPSEIDKEYNHALSQMARGKNTLIGYKQQLKGLEQSLFSPRPISLLLGQQGVGKTALVEQYIYNQSKKAIPTIIIQLNLEKLGELGDNLVVSRIRTMLTAGQEIEQATQKENPGIKFKMALFVDELHKLNNYGKANKGDLGSSGAMNALKEETSRGIFPLIGATTRYEYQNNIKPDAAFARRFSIIEMVEPDAEIVVKIVKRYIVSQRERGEYTPQISEQNIQDLVKYANAYVYDQANPAKTLSILDKCIAACRMAHAYNPLKGGEISHDIIRDAFLELDIDIDNQNGQVKLIIPPQMKDKYNGALTQLPMGDNTLIGYKEQLKMLDAIMLAVETPSALLLGEAGIGKTALVEQWIYDRSRTSEKVAVISLKVEKLGELPENIVIGRMRDLLEDLRLIRKQTQEGNPRLNFQMILFIDEIHKLNSYGPTKSNEGSSAAMNALKEGLARGTFPIIGATTDYEYRSNIVGDQAFDRRFGKISMMQPTLEQVIMILRRRLEADNRHLTFKIVASDKAMQEITSYADSFIRNQVNPAKSLAILDKCTGFCRQEYQSNPRPEVSITHEIIRTVFASEGYSIDTMVSPEHVEKVVKSRIFGQPLALHQLAEVVRTSLYAKRNFDRPLMTAFFVGSTGVGKTETAKQLAKAFFGRRDAMIVINGGDYATKDSAIDAQRYIGDRVQINKQQLILIDEIEKANISVMDTFMRMIDDGIVRDSHNIDRSINSTVVVATSNLGANIFKNLADTFHLDRSKDPDKLDQALIYEWWTQENELRSALQNGDPGRNNGIKPEFLERFSLFVPFLPLAKKTIARIARRQVQDFAKNMQDAGRYSIRIQLPAPKSNAFWQTKLGKYTEYGDDDPISVMIAEDVISKDAKTTGARTISRYINQYVKPAVVDELDKRIKQGLPYDGVFRLEYKNASFQTNEGEMPEVTAEYVAPGNS